MSIGEAQDRIIEELSALDDWMDRYAYLIDGGKRIGDAAEGVRTEENLVRGCQSQVWIAGSAREGRMRFAADSDAAITRGLLALALRVFDGRPPDEILRAELYVFDRTGLQSNLSPARANGLASIVARLREIARSCA